jgi:hypothetical protein
MSARLDAIFKFSYLSSRLESLSSLSPIRSRDRKDSTPSFLHSPSSTDQTETSKSCSTEGGTEFGTELKERQTLENIVLQDVDYGIYTPQSRVEGRFHIPV